MGQRLIGTVGEVRWKQNLFESYHCHPLLNSRFAGTATTIARAVPVEANRVKPAAGAGFSPSRVPQLKRVGLHNCQKRHVLRVTGCRRDISCGKCAQCGRRSYATRETAGLTIPIEANRSILTKVQNGRPSILSER